MVLGTSLGSFEVSRAVLARLGRVWDAIWVRLGVSEGVYLPRAPGHLRLTEVFHQELVAARRLIHHRHPQGRCLVMHAPPAVYKLQSALMHQRTR